MSWVCSFFFWVKKFWVLKVDMISEYNEPCYFKRSMKIWFLILRPVKNTAIPETTFVLFCRPLTPIITKTLMAWLNSGYFQCFNKNTITINVIPIHLYIYCKWASQTPSVPKIGIKLTIIKTILLKTHPALSTKVSFVKWAIKTDAQWHLSFCIS